MERHGVTWGTAGCLRLRTPFLGEMLYLILFVNIHKKGTTKMRRIVNTFMALLLILAVTVCLGACGEAGDPWEDAIYTEDAVIGEGNTTVYVEVKVGEHSVTFTVKTDKTILGEALQSNGLVEGEESTFGLYIKKVNGITADYDVDGSYWGFYKNGEYMMVGVDSCEFADGEHYELVREK